MNASQRKPRSGLTRSHMPEDVEAASAPRDQKEVASYIAQMAQELIGMAQNSGLDLAGFFLKMAHAECVAIAQGAPSLRVPTR